MELTVYNPQECRLETIEVVFTEENTTWFDNCRKNHDIHMITDFEGDLLIRECGYDYPLRINGVSRANIGNNQKRAKQLQRQYL